MTQLVEAFARLRAKWADDPAFLTSSKTPLPANVKYSSLDAAKILATIAFPSFSPVLFMWVDVSNRVSKCAACETPIPPASDRVACHTILHSGRRIGNGWKGSERAYYHPVCFDEALVTGDNARSRSSCFECGAEPTDDNMSTATVATWSDRIYVGSYYSWARLCLACRDNKFWFRCAMCKLLHKEAQVQELYVDVVDILANDLGDPDDGGNWWMCHRCHKRYHRNWVTVEEAEARRQAQRDEERKVSEYREALARGERPEHPWGGAEYVDPDLVPKLMF